MAMLRTRLVRAWRRYRGLIGVIVFIEVVAASAYWFLASAAYYAQIYRGLRLEEFVPFQVAQLGAILAIQTALIIGIFIRWSRGQAREAPELVPLLSKAEDGRLEFKSTFRWDVRQGGVNRALERAALKTVAGFLNTRGGHLILGISDGREPVGLEVDMASLPRRDRDGWENHFSSVFNAMLGARHRDRVRLSWHEHGGKDVCVVAVMPADRPVFLAEDGREEFFVRTGNGTAALKLSEATEYIRTRFR